MKPQHHLHTSLGAILLALTIALGFSFQPLLADTFGNFTYTDHGTYISIDGYPQNATGTVDIPASIASKPVTEIGTAAFYGCSSLTGVTIPNTVTDILDQAFEGCTGLMSVTIPINVTGIGYAAFSECSSLTSVTIPNSVTFLGDSAFSECSGLESVTLSNNMTEIGWSAFASCTSLESVTIPASVEIIGYRAFASCDSLADVTIPASVKSIGDSAFSYCESLISLAIPASVTSIGDSAFSNCSGLLSVAIPVSVTSIGESAFDSCTSLTSVTIPASVTSMGDYAFINCTSLNNLTISNGVTSIGDVAFAGCTSLTSVSIPASVSSIIDAPFVRCTSLTAITVDAANASYKSVNGVLYNKAQTRLIQYPLGKSGSNYSIPNSVTIIGYGAFMYCNLTSVTIPNSVTTIGGFVFAFSPSLTNATIAASVTSIGDGAFYDCGSLTSATFLGNAPTMDTENGVFFNAASGFKVYYDASKTGFTSPIWYGYPSVGLAPEIAVQQPLGTNVPDAGSKAYGSVLVGSNKSLSFTIKNTGNGNLTGIAITKNGTHAADFSVTTAPATTVAPGASTTFTVKFTPGAIGSRSAAIHIANNDSNEKPYDINLSGTGLAPEIAIQQPVGTNIPDAGSKSYGKVAIGSGKSLTYTIKNTGTANLTGIVITKNGANAKDFKIMRAPATTVAPGGKTTFVVKFTPKRTGSRRAAIHIANNDPNEKPFDIKLSGTGIAAGMTSSASSMHFASELLTTTPTIKPADKSKTVITVDADDGLKYLTLVVMKAPGTADQPRPVEVSPNLIDWFSGPNHTTVLKNNESILQVRDNTPLTEGTKRFIRLKTPGH